ncbi:MAG: response regulator [candidate division NC10 bacterium]|nr:response regulator [candidate division NC10 bacterium]
MERILVADDDALVCWSLHQALIREGYEVQLASSGDEALDKVKATNFNLIITDLVMPGLSGIELIRRIKEAFPEIGVGVITGHGSRDVEREVREKGVIFYIEKPFQIEEIKQIVKMILRCAS